MHPNVRNGKADAGTSGLRARERERESDMT